MHDLGREIKSNEVKCHVVELNLVHECANCGVKLSESPYQVFLNGHSMYGKCQVCGYELMIHQYVVIQRESGSGYLLSNKR